MVFDDWRTQRPCAGLSPASIPWRVQISRSRSADGTVLFIFFIMFMLLFATLSMSVVLRCASPLHYPDYETQSF
jgi:hypothetical protein